MPQATEEEMLTEQEVEEALKRVKEQLWTKHATDVGLVKSAGLVKIQVRPNAQLHYQRQYAFSARS